VDVKLICSSPEGHAGCLTDGKRWDFVYLKPALVRKVSRNSEAEDVEGYEVYETRDLGSKKKEEIKKIMGICGWDPAPADSEESWCILSQSFHPVILMSFRYKKYLWLRRLTIMKRNGVVCSILEVTEVEVILGNDYCRNIF
jgi:hypothetical protein